MHCAKRMSVSETVMHPSHSHSFVLHSHTRRVCKWDRVLHYLPRQVKFYSSSFHVIDISVFFNAIDCYIILKGVLLQNTWGNQQHKYLKRGGREPVASKKMTLGQVVPNFTGQNIANFHMKIVSVYVVFDCQNDLKTQKTM